MGWAPLLHGKATPACNPSSSSPMHWSPCPPCCAPRRMTMTQTTRQNGRCFWTFRCYRLHAAMTRMLYSSMPAVAALESRHHTHFTLLHTSCSLVTALCSLTWKDKRTRYAMLFVLHIAEIAGGRAPLSRQTVTSCRYLSCPSCRGSSLQKWWRSMLAKCVKSDMCPQLHSNMTWLPTTESSPAQWR